MLIKLLNPSFQPKKGLLLGHIIDEDHSVAVLVEVLSDGTEPLLTSSIPDANFDWGRLIICIRLMLRLFDKDLV